MRRNARLAKERDPLVAAGAMGPGACKRARAEFDRHHRACLASFKMQHATVRGHAAWLFGAFDASTGDRGAGIPVPQVGFERLRTVEDADAARSRVHRAVTDPADEKLNSLRAGRPEGLKTFAGATSPGTARYWREFTARQVHPQGYTGDGGARTLVTIDERGDGWHVCFMHDWNSVGVSVTNAVERLASAACREARAMAEQQAPKARGTRAWSARQAAARGRPPGPGPARFHFYQHIPPRGLHVSERFDRVDLSFRGGEYRGPKWVACRVVPKLVQSARPNCARDASQANAQPQTMAVSDQRAAEGKA